MSISNSSALAGLSGYDFSGIQDTMVNNYSLPLVQMTQKQTSLQTKQAAWRDVNTRLSALENTLDKLRQTTTWSTTAASSSSANILEAKSAPATTKGNYTVKVIQTALAQTVASGIQAVEKASTATELTAGIFNITAGGKTADITIETGASLEQIAASINDAKVGVSASVVKVDSGYRLAIISAETGTENAAAFKEVTGSVLHDLDILTGEGEGTLEITQAARDAQIEINGISEITSATNTVTSAIPGLTLTLHEAAPNTDVIVKVDADYSEAEKAVQAFVDQYNSTMTFIEGKLAYNKDTKIKGDLFGDQTLQSIQSRLRNMVSSPTNNPSGPFKILADIGVATSADNFGKSAVLKFDTSKFSQAVQENADSVANLLGAPAGGITPVTSSAGSGGAQGLANIMKEYLHPMVMYQGTLDKTQNNYDTQLTNLKKQIDDFTDRVAAYSERIRLRFATLETQLAALDSQNQWLQQQVKSLDSSRDS